MTARALPGLINGQTLVKLVPGREPVCGKRVFTLTPCQNERKPDGHGQNRICCYQSGSIHYNISCHVWPTNGFKFRDKTSTMNDKKFDPNNLERLNNPDRLKDLPPQFIWEKTGLDSAETIVDIGAGTGLFSIQFSSYAWQIYACDISERMISWIEKNVCPHHRNISAIQMNERSVPLEDDIAGGIFMINLHHELDEPEAMLTECRRLLKDGGKICIADWKKENMSEDPPVDFRYMPSEVEKQLKKVNRMT